MGLEGPAQRAHAFVLEMPAAVDESARLRSASGRDGFVARGQPFDREATHVLFLGGMLYRKGGHFGEPNVGQVGKPLPPSRDMARC